MDRLISLPGALPLSTLILIRSVISWCWITEEFETSSNREYAAVLKHASIILRANLVFSERLVDLPELTISSYCETLFLVCPKSVISCSKINVWSTTLLFFCCKLWKKLSVSESSGGLLLFIWKYIFGFNSDLIILAWLICWEINESCNNYSGCRFKDSCRLAIKAEWVSSLIDKSNIFEFKSARITGLKKNAKQTERVFKFCRPKIIFFIQPAVKYWYP